MVIVESLLAARSFGLKPEMPVLSKLGRMVPPLLGVYLAFKLGDMFVRETFVHLKELSTASVMFMAEILLGVVIPLRMFLSPRVVKSPPLLFTAAFLVVGGGLLNRINNFVVAYNPPYSFGSYFPSIGEISVTVGLVSLLVLLWELLFDALLDLAAAYKRNPHRQRGLLAGESVVLYFNKPSTRTRTPVVARMRRDHRRAQPWANRPRVRCSTSLAVQRRGIAGWRARCR